MILNQDQTPRVSTALGRSCLALHLRHRVARGAFRALHFMQICLLSRRSSASGNLAMGTT